MTFASLRGGLAVGLRLNQQRLHQPLHLPALIFVQALVISGGNPAERPSRLCMQR